jgi:hypothetical protein
VTVPVPVFVVVGNVNQGKSSIVAALTEDANVPINAMPGTTVVAAEYAFRVGDDVAFRVIDTPGFQRARHALAWLTARARTVADRPRAVAEFVRTFQGSGEFVDEVRLLAPLVAGGSHIYVVDASARHEPSSEAEMEILRWTGQPGMAVLNRTRERDFSAEWRPILAQFFHVVREFDAHAAIFQDRLDLLRAFREVKDEWRGPMDRAIEAMQREWYRRGEVAVAAIRDLLAAALAHVEKRVLKPGAEIDGVRPEVEAAYADFLRGLERDARAAVETAYGHPRLDRDEATIALLDADLLSEESWQAFGLTKRQLAKAGMLWGAAAGVAVDFALAGLSGFTGALIGAGAGATLGWLGATQLPRAWSKLARALFPGASGRFLAVGPVTNPQFAWTLLDRALVHLRAVRGRSHARRDALALRGEKAGIVAALPGDVRRDVDDALRAVLKGAVRGNVPEDARAQLADALRAASRAEAD